MGPAHTACGSTWRTMAACALRTLLGLGRRAAAGGRPTGCTRQSLACCSTKHRREQRRPRHCNGTVRIPRGVRQCRWRSHRGRAHQPVCEAGWPLVDLAAGLRRAAGVMREARCIDFQQPRSACAGCGRGGTCRADRRRDALRGLLRASVGPPQPPPRSAKREARPSALHKTNAKVNTFGMESSMTWRSCREVKHHVNVMAHIAHGEAIQLKHKPHRPACLREPRR